MGQLPHTKDADHKIGGPRYLLNRYAYVLNNPATLTDPFGLDSKASSAGVLQRLSTSASTVSALGPPKG